MAIITIKIINNNDKIMVIKTIINNGDKNNY